MTSLSLRLRLTVIILGPLILISLAIGAWQVRNATATAADLFDRSLLTTALAVAGDVARSDGEALSIPTRDLLADTSGGPVFYHVYAPDGAFVIGYATPPVPLTVPVPVGDGPFFFDARYMGQEVRVARLRDIASIGGLTGTFTITVWQDVIVRQGFLRRLTSRTFVVIAALIGTVAFVVWFGVNLGLRPLLDLEEAISRRSSDDLGPIRRAVPAEARGIVATLNALLTQVSATMEAQNSFISNAAHQLRNPIAGVLAMAEAVRDAPSGAAAQHRAGELVGAARHAGDLANKLLALERAKTSTQSERFDLCQAVTEVLPDQLPPGVTLHSDIPETGIAITADRVMLREAVSNLLDNALLHGGPKLRTVRVTLCRDRDAAHITVADDGAGVAPDRIDSILARFGQADPGEGSGLGLSIADAVARRHGGHLRIGTLPRGFSVTISLPLPPGAKA